MRHMNKLPRLPLLVAIILIGLQTLNTALGGIPESEEETIEEVPYADEKTSSQEEVVVPVEKNKPLATDDDGTELKYESPKYDVTQFFFVDTFDDIVNSQKQWIKSQAKKNDIAEDIAKYDGVWSWEAPDRIVWKDDIGLVLKSKAKHAAIASRLIKPFTFREKKPLVVQYEVTMQDGQECGGAYIKLLSASKATDDLTKFNDKTPYTIMFGPDKCGNDIKMHFIFRHVNPINGSISEKHCRKPKDRLEEPFKDRLPHLYKLVLKPDNTFEISVDHKVINSGSLLSDFTPQVNPPREIDDPNDKKPEDWDEREKIPDPTAKKPEDWDDDAPPQIPDPNAVMPDGWLEDESEMIPDSSAVKPEDWDADIDGEWEAPLVDNPLCEKAPGCGKWKAPLIANKDYKGKWHAPMIDNPKYRGKWSARKIQNPDFFEDLTPFHMTPISAVGFELWSMTRDILFDNLIITDNVKVANNFAAQTFDVKRKYIDRESKTWWHRLMRHINYRPGMWAAYLLYLTIPAGCYVYYLYRRAKEDTVLSKTTTFIKENPWLFIGIIVVVAMLVTLYCLVRPGRKDTTEDPKKTDDPQPDYVNAAGDGVAGSSPKSKKSDLDVKDPSEARETTSGVEVQARESDKDKESTESFEMENGSEEDVNSKARKRRVRKDES